MTDESSCILEIAMLDIGGGETDAFEHAFEEAQSIVSRMPGYVRHEIRRCVENSERYLLLVWWERLEDHTEGFRQSDDYQEWRALLHQFYDPFPEVEHYSPVVLPVA